MGAIENARPPWQALTIAPPITWKYKKVQHSQIQCSAVSWVHIRLAAAGQPAVKDDAVKDMLILARTRARFCNKSQNFCVSN